MGLWLIGSEPIITKQDNENDEMWRGPFRTSDTNLFRSGANLLTTDDLEEVSNGLMVD